MNPDSSNTRLDDSDLNEIEDWCEDVLNGYREGKSLGARLCAYTDDLPTHSIRSTVASLVAEVRRLRADAPESVRLAEALRALKDAAKQIDFARPGQLTAEEGWALIHADDEACEALAEFGQQPTGDES